MIKKLLGVGLLMVIIGHNLISQPTNAKVTALSVPILMYHKVSPDLRAGGYGLRVSPDNFEQQIKLLADLGYQSVNLGEVVAFLRQGRPIPEKSVVITFDDGYRDNFYWARPILLKYGFRATFFLVSERVGKTNTWDQAKGSPHLELLNTEEIRTMVEEGFQFGAHSRTHTRLTDLSAAKAKDQIAGSKGYLEKTLGVPINYFCYPYGRYNKLIVDLVRKSGYAAALTTAQGRVRRGDNIMTLKRIRITGQYNQTDFLQALNNGRESL
ncbi:MAG: polysaccharide deacetylase family protein [Carboxydocellales bacterium]